MKIIIAILKFLSTFVMRNTINESNFEKINEQFTEGGAGESTATSLRFDSGVFRSHPSAVAYISKLFIMRNTPEGTNAAANPFQKLFKEYQEFKRNWNFYSFTERRILLGQFSDQLYNIDCYEA